MLSSPLTARHTLTSIELSARAAGADGASYMPAVAFVIVLVVAFTLAVAPLFSLPTNPAAVLGTSRLPQHSSPTDAARPLISRLLALQLLRHFSPSHPTEPPPSRRTDGSNLLLLNRTASPLLSFCAAPRCGPQDMLLLTLLHRRKQSGPPHDPYRGVVERWRRPADHYTRRRQGPTPVEAVAAAARNGTLSALRAALSELRVALFPQLLSDPHDWQLVWRQALPGPAEHLTSSADGERVAVSFRQLRDEGTRHTIRYLTVPHTNADEPADADGTVLAEDIPLPGSLPVSTLSLAGSDCLVYARYSDSHLFRTYCRRPTGRHKSSRRQWRPLLPGPLVDRRQGYTETIILRGLTQQATGMAGPLLVGQLSPSGLGNSRHSLGLALLLFSPSRLSLRCPPLLESLRWPGCAAGRWVLRAATATQPRRAPPQEVTDAHRVPRPLVAMSNDAAHCAVAFAHTITTLHTAPPRAREVDADVGAAATSVLLELQVDGVSSSAFKLLAQSNAGRQLALLVSPLDLLLLSQTQYSMDAVDDASQLQREEAAPSRGREAVPVSPKLREPLLSSFARALRRVTALPRRLGRAFRTTPRLTRAMGSPDVQASSERMEKEVLDPHEASSGGESGVTAQQGHHANAADEARLSRSEQAERLSAELELSDALHDSEVERITDLPNDVGGLSREEAPLEQPQAWRLEGTSLPKIDSLSKVDPIAMLVLPQPEQQPASATAHASTHDSDTAAVRTDDTSVLVLYEGGFLVSYNLSGSLISDQEYSIGALTLTAASTSFWVHILIFLVIAMLLSMLVLCVGLRFGLQWTVVAWPIYPIMWAHSALRFIFDFVLGPVLAAVHLVLPGVRLNRNAPPPRINREGVPGVGGANSDGALEATLATNDDAVLDGVARAGVAALVHMPQPSSPAHDEEGFAHVRVEAQLNTAATLADGGDMNAPDRALPGEIAEMATEETHAHGEDATVSQLTTKRRTDAVFSDEAGSNPATSGSSATPLRTDDSSGSQSSDRGQQSLPSMSSIESSRGRSAAAIAAADAAEARRNLQRADLPRLR